MQIDYSARPGMGPGIFLGLNFNFAVRLIGCGMVRLVFFFLSLVAISSGNGIFAAEPVLSHGPMIGHVGMNEAWIWGRLEVPGQLRLRVFLSDQAQAFLEIPAEFPGDADNTGKWHITGLAPDTAYRAEIGALRAGVPVEPVFFRTAPLEDAPVRFSFQVGSCAQDKRFPVQRVWRAMGDLRPNFFLGLGDLPYIDSTAIDIQRKRYREFYSLDDLRRFQALVPCYSVWDDHDFAGNDKDGNSPGVKNSRKVFSEYHASPNSFTISDPMYFHMRYGDVEFWILDDETYLNTAPSPFNSDRPTFLGERQWQWLFSGLKDSKAPFKFVASGSPWTDDIPASKIDAWRSYPYERDAFYAFLARERIPGVILLSGDFHQCRLHRNRTKDSMGYDLYEVISSPLANTPRAPTPGPTLVASFSEEQQFAHWEIDTTAQPATAIMTFRNEKGIELFRRIFTASELTP